MTITTIKHDGDTWNVIAKGADRDGKTFCHLASTTRGCHQRNGFSPVQINDWISNEVLAIAEHYTDRSNSGLAALAR